MIRQSLLWFSGLGLLLAACLPARPTPSPEVPTLAWPTDTPAVPTPTFTFTPAEALLAPTAPQAVTFPASDGVRLAATYYPPVMTAAAQAAGRVAPGVLLLHMLGHDRNDWATFAVTLQAQGYAVLTPDLRGHGSSGGVADWSQAPADVRAAWDFLVSQPQVNAHRSAIVGASIGANLALIVGANNSDVATVIALSPGLDYHGLMPAELLPNFGMRPLLLVASQNDEYAYTSTQALAPRAPAAQTHYFTAAGHGVEMFSDPALEPLLLDWLRRCLEEMKG